MTIFRDRNNNDNDNDNHLQVSYENIVLLMAEIY